MPSVGLLDSPRYVEHDAGPGHPESPQRLRAIREHLQAAGLLKRLHLLSPRPHGPSWVESVHSREYVRRVQAACESGASSIDSPDTGICRQSFEVALLAVDGALTLVDEVMGDRPSTGSGRSDPVRRGFGLVRPPGHHAERELALGFCLFNNVAIAACYARKEHGVPRIAIVDWDVHHGNGTQHAFEQDPGVLYVSTHQWPLYPGTGRRDERGRGNILNIPLAPHSGDAEYLRVFEEEIVPALDRFKPELLLISAGFDAHREDPLAQMDVTEQGYRFMTERVVQAAERHARGRVVSLLEGGYHLPSLGRSVEAHLEALMEYNPAA